MAFLDKFRVLCVASALLLASACSVAAQPPMGPCPPVPVERQQAWDKRLSEAAKKPAATMDAIGVREEAKAFCKREKAHVMCAGGPGRDLTLNEVWAVDKELRAHFTYRFDYLSFGVDDYWMSKSLCGDCEDYTLNLASRLHVAGASGSSLNMMVWSPAEGVGHTTLVVKTADAGYVEVGVGPGETPHPLNLGEGVRIGYLPFDGKQTWIAVAFSRMALE